MLMELILSTSVIFPPWHAAATALQCMFDSTSRTNMTMGGPGESPTRCWPNAGPQFGGQLQWRLQISIIVGMAATACKLPEASSTTQINPPKIKLAVFDSESVMTHDGSSLIVSHSIRMGSAVQCIHSLFGRTH